VNDKADRKEQVRAIHREVNAALEQIAKKHGYAFKPASARFDFTSIKFNAAEFYTAAEGSVPGGPAVSNREVTSWSLFAPGNNLKADFLGTNFQAGDGKTYRVVGWSPSKPKNPVMLLCVTTGKSHKAPVGWVRQNAPQALIDPNKKPNIFF